MQTLELKEYSLTEIKEITQKARKRDVMNVLDKLGYDFHWYNGTGVEITKLPTEKSPAEQLKSLLFSTLDLDVRTDVTAFAAYFYKMMDDDLFLTTPWEAKAKELKREFGIDISDRTLRTYNAKLINKDMLIKNDDMREDWYTTYVGYDKVQDVVWTSDEDAVAAMEDWYNKRSQYLIDADIEYQKAIGEADVQNPKRWRIALKRLWDETKCFYFPVKGWSFNNFHKEELEEIYKLSSLVIADIELSEEEVSEVVERKSIGVNDCVGANGEFVF